MFAAAARGGGGGGGGDWGGGSGEDEEWQEIHPVVARRGLDFLWYLCKTSFRVTYDMLTVGPAEGGDDLALAPGGGVVEGGARGSSGKGKGKGRRGGSGKAKGKAVEAMDVAGEWW